MSDDGIIRFDVGERVELCVHCLCSGEFGIVDEGACVLCGFRPPPPDPGLAVTITEVDRERGVLTVSYDAAVECRTPGYRTRIK